MDASSRLSDALRGEKDFSPSFLNQIGPLLILAAIFFLNFVARIILAPLIPTIEVDLNLSHADAGFLFFLLSLGYFITLVGSGFVSSRLNHKRTIALSNTALGLALIGTAFCIGPRTIRLGLLLVGMAAGLYLSSGISMLTSQVQSRHWGKAIAIHELAPNLGFVAAPLISEAVLVWFSWRMVFLFLGFTALTMSPVFLRYSHGGEIKGEAPSWVSFREVFGNKSFWIMVLLFSLGIIGSMAVYTMLPLYLVTEHGMARNLANTMIALSRISCVMVSFVSGWATDRIGPRQTLRMVFLISGLMTIFLGIAPNSYIPYLVFLQPPVAVCFFPAGFAALSSIVSVERRNIAVSLTVPMAFLIGGGLAPVFIGIIGEMRSFALGIAICGGLITAGSFFSGILKFQNHEI
jgi:NNP family nitrate/nitrite transporter-like MFS transporter